MPAEVAVVPVPVAEAALRLGATREIVIRRITTGELRGGQDERRRWFVDAESLGEYEAARADNGAKHRARVG